MDRPRPLISLPLAGDRPEIREYTGPPAELEAAVARIKTIKNADRITGGLSKPSKMPEYAYNLSAAECLVGSRLQQIRGSVCHKCYALTNRYRHKKVKEAMERRRKALFHEDWVPAMVLSLRKKQVKHFRWHDSGDVSSVSHQWNIAKVAEYTPETQHWQPSREIEIVREALRRIGVFPENLTIRMSAHLIGAPGPSGFETTSTVHASRKDIPDGSFVCPAPDTDNQCGECRACWNNRVRNVSYWLH